MGIRLECSQGDTLSFWHGSFFSLILRSDGEVRLNGIDYETRKMEVVCRNDRTIVLKVPGRSVWNGKWSPRSYAPPQMLVFSIVDINHNSFGAESLTVTPVIGWSTQRKTEKQESP